MKTDKLYYRIFLSQPSLLADLLPGLPADCTFEYVAPVVKESEFRLDGSLMPQSENPEIPVIFLEAQMQPDGRFYGLYFAELFLYLYQYRIERPWRGLLILQSPQQDLWSTTPYGDRLDGKVQRIYLQDLLGQTGWPPALALLQLIILPESAVPEAAKTILDTATSEGSQVFRQTLDLVEAILINKFPQLTSQEILAMLDIKTTDLRQTRFYQEVFQEGREEGAQQAKANLLVRLLARNLGALSEEQETQIRTLSLEQLDALGDALFDVADHDALNAWLQAHPIEPQQLEEE